MACGLNDVACGSWTLGTAESCKSNQLRRLFVTTLYLSPPLEDGAMNAQDPELKEDICYGCVEHVIVTKVQDHEQHNRNCFVLRLPPGKNEIVAIIYASYGGNLSRIRKSLRRAAHDGPQFVK